MPAPNVDSAVIRLDISKDKKYDVSDEQLFFKIVRASFAQRRKQLLNPLSSALGMEKAELSDMLVSCGIKTTARPEELKMQDFVNLCEAINNKK